MSGFQGLATVIGVVIGLGLLAYEYYNYRNRQNQDDYQYGEQEPNYQYTYNPPPAPPPPDRSTRAKRRAKGSTSEKCAICLEKYLPGKQVLECGHAFHAKCIEKWFKETRSCPVCRIKL